MSHGPLKGMCHRPCSICDVTVSQIATTEPFNAKTRCPASMVEKPLEPHGRRVHGHESMRRDDIRAGIASHRHWQPRLVIALHPLFFSIHWNLHDSCTFGMLT